MAQETKWEDILKVAIWKVDYGTTQFVVVITSNFTTRVVI